MFCCETWSLTLRMQQRLRFSENRMLRNMFRPDRDEVNRERKRLYNKEIYNLHSSPYVIWVTKSRRMRRVEHIAHMGDGRCANGFWRKSLGDRDHLKALGLYGWITLIWIFRLIQIIHMTPGQQSGKYKPLTSLMDYSLSRKYGSKQGTNYSNVLIHSPITVLSMVP